MSTDTILTPEEIGRIAVAHGCDPDLDDGALVMRLCRAIEQALLQSDRIRAMDGMASCMDMVRQELIEAGIITEKVPPMFVANAVLTEVQALRKDAERYRFMRSVENGAVLEAAIDAAMEKQP